jgi:hypothetical protein
MAWAIVRCSRDYIQQEAEAKAAGAGVHSHDCDLRAGRAARAGFLAARLVLAEIGCCCSQRWGIRLSESFWGVLNADGVGAL